MLADSGGGPEHSPHYRDDQPCLVHLHLISLVADLNTPVVPDGGPLSLQRHTLVRLPQSKGGVLATNGSGVARQRQCLSHEGI